MNITCEMSVYRVIISPKPQHIQEPTVITPRFHSFYPAKLKLETFGTSAFSWRRYFFIFSI